MRQPIALLLCTLLCTLLLGSMSFAQEASEPTISTDRPSVGTGPDLVPPHWSLSENGIGVSSPAGVLTIDGLESLARYGISDRVEIRAAMPDAQRTRGLPKTRWQDASLGAKIRLPAARSWPLSAVVSLSLPTGSDGVSSGGFDPAILLASSHAWNPRLSTYASAGFASVSGQGRGREQADQLAVFATWALSGKLTSFIEYAPLLSHDPQLAAATADSGLLWVVRRRFQIDARVGATIDSSGSHPLVGVGYSFLFRKFPLCRLQRYSCPG